MRTVRPFEVGRAMSGAQRRTMGFAIQSEEFQFTMRAFAFGSWEGTT